MKAWPVMLALVPSMPLAPIEPANGEGPAVSCAIAIAIDVRAPLAWGDREWHLFTREVEATWAAYGLTFCWAHGPDRCEGFEVRVRVLISPNLPPQDTTDGKPSLGRIPFRDGSPLSNRALAGRRLEAFGSRASRRPSADGVAGGCSRRCPAADSGARAGARDWPLHAPIAGAYEPPD